MTVGFVSRRSISARRPHIARSSRLRRHLLRRDSDSASNRSEASMLAGETMRR